MLPMSYRLSKPGLRYKEEISTLFFVNNQKYATDHGKINFIIHKNNLAFELVWSI